MLRSAADLYGKTMQTCSVDPCNRKRHARGYCSMHYQRWRTHGDPTIALHRDRITADERVEQQRRSTLEWKRANRDRVNEQERARRLAVKVRCFALYGGRCQGCGFEDVRALQLDHIDGPDNAQRGQYMRSGIGVYRAILRGEIDPELFQLLCANCNWIKRWELDECRKRAVNVAISP